MTGEEIAGLVIGVLGLVAIGYPLFIWSRKVHRGYKTWVVAVLCFFPAANILFMYPYTAGTEVGWSESKKAVMVMLAFWCNWLGLLLVTLFWLNDRRILRAQERERENQATGVAER